MKVQIKGKSYTMAAIVSETIEVPGLVGKKEVVKAVVYCYDKERKPYKFLADEIERYD